MIIALTRISEFLLFFNWTYLSQKPPAASQKHPWGLCPVTGPGSLWHPASGKGEHAWVRLHPLPTARRRASFLFQAQGMLPLFFLLLFEILKLRLSPTRSSPNPTGSTPLAGIFRAISRGVFWQQRSAKPQFLASCLCSFPSFFSKTELNKLFWKLHEKRLCLISFKNYVGEKKNYCKNAELLWNYLCFRRHFW